MKTTLLAVFLWCVPVIGWPQPGLAVKQLTGAECLKNAAIGLSVKQVADGKEIAAFNPQMSLAPASVSKLLPSVFALAEKGKDYCYHTTVFYDGTVRNGTLTGDLVVTPGGDPCPESSYFKEHRLITPLVEAIRREGITAIQGNIRVEMPENEKGIIPGTWVWEDISNYYGTCYHPFNYRDNLYTLELKSGSVGKTTELLRVVPDVPGLRFCNEVVASEQNKDNAWIYGGPYSPVQYVRGTIPANRACFKVKGAMPDPVVCFVEELSKELLKQGIRIEKRKTNTPDGSRTKILTLESPSLQEIVYHTNKSSVNLFAEALGHLAVGEEDVQEGMVALLKKAGIGADGIILKDACGLSPMNAVPARVFTDLLVWADKKLGDPFVRSLPVAGVDGLNGYHGGNSLLKNNLRAKTGSFAGVRCLSGYLKNRSGKQLAFTILINHYTCDTAKLQQAVSLFLGELAKS